MRAGVNRVKPVEKIGTISSRGRIETKSDASQETSDSDSQGDAVRELVEKEPDGRDKGQPCRSGGAKWKRLIADVCEQDSGATAGKQWNSDEGCWYAHACRDCKRSVTRSHVGLRSLPGTGRSPEAGSALL